MYIQNIANKRLYNKFSWKKYCFDKKIMIENKFVIKRENQACETFCPCPVSLLRHICWRLSIPLSTRTRISQVSRPPPPSCCYCCCCCFLHLLSSVQRCCCIMTGAANACFLHWQSNLSVGWQMTVSNIGRDHMYILRCEEKKCIFLALPKTLSP